MLVACRLAGLSPLETYYAGLGGFILEPAQVREPRAAWAREVLSAVALGQRHQNVGQGRVRAEPREQAIKTIAPRSLATRAVDADDGQGELAERVGAARRGPCLLRHPAFPCVNAHI
jgi:hypothetical protein